MSNLESAPLAQTADAATAHAGGLRRDELLIQHRRRLVGFVHPPEGVEPLDYVFCPAGHHIERHKLAQFQESGRYTCDYREPPGNGRPCGRELLVLFVHRRSRDSHGQPIRKVWVAEVDWREFEYMETAGMDVFEMIAFLNEKYDPPRRPNAIDKRLQRKARAG